jgi:hypothetical protein
MYIFLQQHNRFRWRGKRFIGKYPVKTLDNNVSIIFKKELGIKKYQTRFAVAFNKPVNNSKLELICRRKNAIRLAI